MSVPKLDHDALDFDQRLRALAAPIISRETDDALQAIVRQASDRTGFPIALVSLVLRRTQFFKAHVGLPQRLQVTRSTNRCASFCQFVASSGESLMIPDTFEEPDLPSELIDAYGLRAYIAVPLRVSGQVVGTLCVLDTEPRALDPEMQQDLTVLGQAAATRLADLAGASGRVEQEANAIRPVFMELRNLMMGLDGVQLLSSQIAAEAAPLISLVGAHVEGTLSDAETLAAMRDLTELDQLRDDLGELSGDLRHLIDRAWGAIRSLELVAAPHTDLEGRLSVAFESARNLALHITRLVEDVSWPDDVPDVPLADSSRGIVLAITSALTTVAMTVSRAGGRMLVRVEADEQAATVTLHAPGTAAGLETVPAQIEALQTRTQVHVVGDRVTLRWLRA